MKLLLLTALTFISTFAIAQKITVEALSKENKIILQASNQTSDDYEVEITLLTKGYGLKRKEVLVKNVPAGQIVILGTYQPKSSRSKRKPEFKYEYATTKLVSSEKADNAMTHESKSEAKVQNTEVPQDQNMDQKPMNVDSDAKAKGLVVYSKKGCGRCIKVCDFLKTNEIPFTEYDITDHGKEFDQLTKLLFANGFKGGQFTTPVVSLDDEVHYNIKNLDDFLQRLLK